MPAGIAVYRWDEFQSTLPRGERRKDSVAMAYIVDISIHAPAWGATKRWLWYRGMRRISIHAPAWGATLRWKAAAAPQQYFNPRSRVGSDTRTLNASSRSKTFQSTLPRGERRFLRVFLPCMRYFNPRSRVGSDQFVPPFSRLMFEFQSTLPRGERPVTPTRYAHCNIFQSTLPRGERRDCNSMQ